MELALAGPSVAVDACAVLTTGVAEAEIGLTTERTGVSAMHPLFHAAASLGLRGILQYLPRPGRQRCSRDWIASCVVTRSCHPSSRRRC